jgi:uncharacterized protein
MKKIIFFIIFIFALSACLFLILFKKNSRHSENTVCFEKHCFLVKLAIRDDELKQGLMFRKSLDQNRGMLFVFKKEDKYPFWMKNTLIPLDIIWINAEKEVVFINKNTQPCLENYCQSIKPDKNAKYVLEINSGLTDKINLNLGDKLIFNTDEY